MVEEINYPCDVCGAVMEEEPDYEVSGKDEGIIAFFCAGCVETGAAFDWLRKNLVPPTL